MSDLTQIIEEFIKPHLPAPYELIDVEWTKMGADMVLSILVDKEPDERSETVTIDETAELSEIISPLLDEIRPDPFPKEGYLLEVASPGAERPLKRPKDFEKALGENVFLTTYQKIDGEKEFMGDLIKYDGESVKLEVTIKNGKTKHVKIPISAIAKAQTMVKF